MEFIYVSPLVIAGKDFMLYVCRLYGTDTGNVAIACRASDISRVSIPIDIYFYKLLLSDLTPKSWLFQKVRAKEIK